MIQLDVTVVNVAVKQIGATFGGGVAELQWVVSSYILMLAALILPAGALGDRFGAKRVLLAGFAIFVAASMACGLAPGFPVLIAARAVQGTGAALLGACSLALLNDTFTSAAERARAIGLWAAGASSALSGGPVVGGILIAALGWRSIFFLNAPIGLAGLWLIWRYAHDTPRAAHHRGTDLTGAVSAVVALAAPVAVGFLVNVCFYGLIFLFSLLFPDPQGMSALRAGLAFTPMTAAILAANLLSGRVSAAVGPVRAILAGLAAMAIGCAALLWTGPATGYPAMAGQQVLLGGGLGLLVPPMTALLLSGAERSRSGVASGALTAFRQAGSLLGVAVFGALAAGGHFYRGLHAALWVSVAVLAASGLLIWFRGRGGEILGT